MQNYYGYETNLEAMNLLGNLQNKLDLKDDAIHTFMLADDFCESNNASVKYSIGLLYFQNGNYLKASNYFGDAVNYNTENIHYKFCLVNID
jgi:tetratricopeptide (TPR) repeat protein